jgi:hypothetical protein
VPLNTEPASTNPLTCPDASTYYTHEGLSTTAQYYVNNQGVTLENACIWGTDGTDEGNWAPTFFGVGQDVYGKTYLSIATTIQNNPTNYKPLNYTVKIIGNISGNCGLVNGQYCTGGDFSECNTSGCTVSIILFSQQCSVRANPLRRSSFTVDRRRTYWRMVRVSRISLCLKEL